MAEALALSPPPLARVRDVLAVCKPRITGMVVFTAGMGAWLAPGSMGAARATAFLFFTAVLVASANALNSFLEREQDGRMRRTAGRPLPAGRLDPWSALALGVAGAVFAVPALMLVGNAATAALGVTAWISYVAVYTPLKRVTPWALEIGAIPGAIPPLMGWTAAAGAPGAGGWALFSLLFFWQLPHFVAIALYLKDDYGRGGFRVLPAVRGEAAARRRLVAYTALLAVASLACIPLAGPVYAAVAAVTGSAFMALALAGLSPSAGAVHARRVFLFSLVYLVIVLPVLVLDAR
jgi:protoheme IX farnesyltransferase